VEIVGNQDVSQRTILSGLTFRSGDPFRGRDLRDSQRHLYRSGVFRSVALGVSDSLSTGNRVGVQVQVSERPFRSVRRGGGFDTDEDMWASAAWMHRNFGGGARQLRLSGRISGQNREAVVGLRESYFLDSRNWLNVSGFLQRERQATFEQDELGGNLALERNIAEGADLVLHASGGVVDFSADSAFTEVGVRVFVDTRDDVFDPQQGILAQINLRERGQLLKADEEFLQATAESRWFVRIPLQSVLAFRAQGGVIFELGKAGGVRPVERFFAGGLNSLRGWALDEVGPKDANNDPLGGLTRVEMSLEVRTRILPFVGTALFVDVGNVHSDLGAFKPKDLKWSVGAGLRYLSPIGPIRYDVGVRLSGDRPGVGRTQHHISLGQAF
ncbi:MAG: BamA/TamA family outer membrane protein, partial [Candidatus Latescibacteria bacterium]|nr:BamA/TamA family outer membrane protein [Candidatus Latescibacterota bacterium]